MGFGRRLEHIETRVDRRNDDNGRFKNCQLYKRIEEEEMNKAKAKFDKLMGDDKLDKKETPSKDSYADIIEGYLIAEESASDDSYYNFSINKDKALQDAHLNITPYPENYCEHSEDALLKVIGRDIKSALPKILSCKEVSDAIDKFCGFYNNTSKEELDKKLCWMNYPSKMTTNWFKSQFRIYKEDDYFVICDEDQNFRCVFALEIISILKSYINKKYVNLNCRTHTGDGDEGCLYIIINNDRKQWEINRNK